MRILIVGNGGREHALAWSLVKSSGVERLFATTPNAGLAELCEAIPVSPEDVGGVTEVVRDLRPDLVVIGPENPLAMGLADALRDMGRHVVGPSREAARLESSKSFMRRFASDHGIPGPAYGVFDELGALTAHLGTTRHPVVLKASGLAYGKGVIICDTPEESKRAARALMVDGRFGEAGATVVVEEHLTGEECSYIALSDGTHVLPLASSQDHKRLLDGDRGPNTGGMGAYSPASVLDPSQEAFATERIMEATVRGMAAKGTPFHGFLYGGLMVTSRGPRLLEFNVRLGDPETQPILARLETDLLEVLEATVAQRLDKISLRWSPQHAVCVVLASGGYPERYPKGLPIEGIPTAAGMEGVTVFHAGTGLRGGRVVTTGGRVLGVTALGDTIEEAVSRAYRAVDAISFEGMTYRRDIGHHALARQ